MKNLNIRDNIIRFVDTIPETVSVKAYGSSVAYQSGYTDNEKKQIDLVVVVDNIKEFYRQNMEKNRYMYKLVPSIYFRLASSLELKKHASICYTSHIRYDGDFYKMGVVEKSDVLDDLLNWKTFFIAGRFQKEMFTVISDSEIENANEINKRNALVASLLLLGDSNEVTLDMLYEKLCSLSYLGDARKALKAEDPDKVKKIARGSKDFFNREYKDKTDLFSVREDEYIDIDYDKLFFAIQYLPVPLYDDILYSINSYMSREERLSTIQSVISNYITAAVKSSSLQQTVRGVLTTGPKNSVLYAVEKLKKGRKKSEDKVLTKTNKNLMHI